MKMIYVACLSASPDRDSGWIREFSEIGWNVIELSSIGKDIPTGIIGKIQRRFNIGNANRIMRSNLLRLVDNEKPIWVHFRLPKETKLVLCKEESPHDDFDPDRALVNYNVMDGDVLILKQV